MPTIKSTIDNNNSDFYVVTTSTDVEKGIDTPLPLEEGVEIPLATFENDLKKKQPPSTPTTIASTSSDDTFINDTSNNGKCWSSWTTLDYTLALVATLAVISVVFFISIFFAPNPTTNNSAATTSTQLQVQRIGNNGTPKNLFPLSKCRGDCDNDQECQEGLMCYQRGSYEGVPGCLGGEVDGSGTDYCVVAVDDDDGKGAAGNSRPINSPSSSSSTITTQEPPTHPRDLFLLSGQSNMVGHTTSSESMTGSADYWNSIKSILDSYSASGGSGNLTSMEEQLYNAIYEANDNNGEANESNDQVATTLTNGVMNLYKSGLLNDLDKPLQFGKCSFQEASDTKVYDVSRGTVPISSKSNCGHSFGHELLFARTMELGSSMNYTTRDFELHKVARGGSGLYEHWYPNHGMHWNLLRSAIEEQRGQQGDWKGFIWHQGSQAVWSAQQYGEDRSLTYYGNLTGLVSEVRELMFQNSITWRCKEEIPVVIVQVGFWPGYKDAANRTRDAQAKFCNQDPRAVLVKTDDLSRYYHYDAASFLISGNRIAQAYQEALGGVVECPDERVPSSSPSEKSMEPSMSLEPTVMRLETDLPSSINTNELV